MRNPVKYLQVSPQYFSVSLERLWQQWILTSHFNSWEVKLTRGLAVHVVTNRRYRGSRKVKMLATRTTSPSAVLQSWSCLYLTGPHIFFFLLVHMCFPWSSPSPDLPSNFCAILPLFLLPMGVKTPALPSKKSHALFRTTQCLGLFSCDAVGMCDSASFSDKAPGRNHQLIRWFSFSLRWIPFLNSGALQ